MSKKLFQMEPDPLRPPLPQNGVPTPI